MELKKLPSDEIVRLCVSQGDAAAWNEFLRRFSRPIARSAIRVGKLWGETSSTVIDDVVQEVFLKLCEDNRRILKEFEPRQQDSFLRFVRVVSAAAANDYFRKRNTVKRGGGAKEAPLTEHLASMVQDSEWLERNYLLKEIDGFLESHGRDEVARRDRTVFWLYYQQGMTANAIACLPGMSLSVKGVESSLHRTIALIRCHMRKPVAEQTVKKSSPRKGFFPASAIQRSEWL